MTRTRPLVAVLGQGGKKNGIEVDELEASYVEALTDVAGVVPFLVPRALPAENLEDWIGRFDGLFLTGDASNIEPWRYGTANDLGRGPYDRHRDALALALVVEAGRRGIPLLGVCRGCEEINVAYGGTLWTALHEEGFLDHREEESPDPVVRYRPAHKIDLAPGGLLRKISGRETWTVNSLHGQGIRALGPGLAIEARAPDGIVEAVRDPEPSRWILGVQWHPEWESIRDTLSRGIFQAFGEACATFRRPPDPTHATRRRRVS